MADVTRIQREVGVLIAFYNQSQQLITNLNVDCSHGTCSHTFDTLEKRKYADG